MTELDTNFLQVSLGEVVDIAESLGGEGRYG